MTLPDPHSVRPEDVALRAVTVWGQTNLVICPTCRGAGMVAYIDHRPVAYACQKCGPISPPAPVVGSPLF